MKTDDIDPKWTFPLHYDLVEMVSHVMRKKKKAAGELEVTFEGGLDAEST